MLVEHVEELQITQQPRVGLNIFLSGCCNPSRWIVLFDYSVVQLLDGHVVSYKLLVKDQIPRLLLDVVVKDTRRSDAPIGREVPNCFSLDPFFPVPTSTASSKNFARTVR